MCQLINYNANQFYLSFVKIPLNVLISCEEKFDLKNIFLILLNITFLFGIVYKKPDLIQS